MDSACRKSILAAIGRLRAAGTRHRLARACEAIIDAIQQLPPETAWTPPLRDAAQPVVSYAEFLMRHPKDPELRRQLESALDDLSDAVLQVP